VNLAEGAYNHRRSILFLLATFSVAGLYSALVLPVSLFPQVTFPRVVVSIDAGDRPAERMAVEVTQPVEEAVRSIPGVQSLRSTTSRGSAQISINFGWGQDMVAATLQTESAINLILSSLPPETKFDVRRMDPTVFPVVGYSLTSDVRSLVDLRDIALYQIRPALTTIPGVASIGVLGGETAEYRVTVDPEKLASFGLTVADVGAALSASNVVSAVGRLEDHNKLYLILSNPQFNNIDEISQTVLRSGSNGLVLVEDVATVSESAAPQWTRVTADGHDAVLFQVYQQPDGNTVQIQRQLRPKLAELQERLPPDVRIANWYDQSELIVASAKSVRDAVVVGVALAAVVILLFLRNLKLTLIAVIAAPTVLATTILLLFVFHMSFNIMTLGGMAAAVGLIIDDAIVMIERILHRLQTGTGDFNGRITRAVTELTRPLVGSSLSTIIIFAPLAFLTGVTGAFFKALSLTMAAALLISFSVAWLVVPIVARTLLRERDAEHHAGGALSNALRGGYARLMHLVLRQPWVILFAIAALLSVGWVCYQHTGTGFMPSMDEGGFILDYRAPSGTSLTDTDRMLRQVETILQDTPEVQTYSRRTGIQLGGGLTEGNEGDFFIRLKPLPRRGLDEVVDEVRQRVESSIPGLQIEMARLMEDLIGDLTAVPQPIEIKLYSDDGQLLGELAPKVAVEIEKIGGIVDVNDGVVLAGDALEIHVNREQAALEGMAADSITQVLNGYLTGMVTTQIQSGPKMIGLRVWIPSSDRMTVKDIESLRLTAPDGHQFPLKRVAQVETIRGQPQIDRDNLKQMVAVTARISGRDLGSTIRDVTEVLDRAGFLPDGVYYQLGGLYEQQQLAFRGMLVVFATAVLFVFVLLLFLYESFRVAVSMMVIALLAVAAVFIGLWLTGTELNITAMMGMTMVVGIVTEASIFYYSELQELEIEEEDQRERLFRAGVNRFRPIAMTTSTAILALSPLALGIGQGPAMQQPLAIAIVSGLAVKLPLVLIVLPALLAMSRSSAR
jgi:CzcA family heavy metal efflux pump